jgi:PAS domain S-box-containing protein
MQKPVRILHLEDNPMDAEMIHAKLESENLVCQILHVKDREEFERCAATSEFDLILSDYSVPHYNGTAALRFVREKNPDVPFILVSGTLGEDKAVDSLKNGATDYIIKQRLERLGPAVTRALQDAEEKRERERVEHELRMEAEASEKRFRTLVEQSLIGIYVIQDERFIYTNPTMEKILGCSQQEIASRPLLDFIFPEDRALVRENIRKRMEGLVKGIHYTLRMLRSDQSMIYVEARGGLVDNFNGRPAIIGTLLDITERKNAEDKLREQATLLEKAQDAICVRDMTHKILYWNKSAERVYGWTAEEAIGQNALVLLHQNDLHVSIEAGQLLLAKGEWTGELHPNTKSGQNLIVESRWTLMRDANGRPQSILLIDTDVTEKKRTEIKLLRTQRMESLGALAGGIAHDLNNCLAPILMAADLIKDDLKSDDSKALMSTMHTSAQRGAGLVRQILSFSRGVTGEYSVLQLKHLIGDMEQFVKSTFPRTIQFRTRIKGKLLPIKGNATQIHQILMNLCINARDAMPDGGSITIEAFTKDSVDEHSKKQVDGAHVVLSVVDTGEGMSPDMIDRIFEPFFTTKEIGKGTGLGLSTVKDIVKAHNGFLEVSSELKKGTRFDVFLPVTDADENSQSRGSVEIPGGSGEQILLVDDETAIVEMLRLMLEAHNYKVLTAKNGIEAVTAFTKYFSQIQIVVTDMVMPDMNGAILIKRLQEIDPNVKIIGMSGLGSNIEQSAVERLPLKAFLKKPFSSESLLIHLHKTLLSASTNYVH